MNTKKCYKCKVEYELNNFGKLKSTPDGFRYDCKFCRQKYREENKVAISIKQQKYYSDNKIILTSKNKTYREINSEKINEQRKEYRSREEVKEYTKQKNKEYLPIKKQKIKEKRITDKNFQLSEILRSKIHKMIKNKKTSYQNIIGCDIEFFKKWIESRFNKNMNWNNLGSYWQIDHILPINAFNFQNDRDKYICFHWTNLQPLESEVNRLKSDNLHLHYYFNNIVSVFRFNKINNKFLGYQAVNESLQWLRIELKDGKNAPYDNATKKAFEIGNPQPSF